MKRRKRIQWGNGYACPTDIVFRPALTPMEAAVIPARERCGGFGALRLARQAFDPWRNEREAARDQRAKIWVR